MRKKRISVAFLVIIMVVGCFGSVTASAFTKTEKSTYKALTQTQKYSAKDACAIMGHMKRQSGMNYSAVSNDGIGHGSMQWCYGRYKNLKKAAKKDKKSWKNANVQRKFIKSEFSKEGVSKKMIKTSDLKKKCSYITTMYIRPSNPKVETELAYKQAKKYYDGRKSLK